VSFNLGHFLHSTHVLIGVWSLKYWHGKQRLSAAWASGWIIWHSHSITVA